MKLVTAFVFALPGGAAAAAAVVAVMRPRAASFPLILSLACALLPGLRADVLILDDALQGSTEGARTGGAFVEGGWKVTGPHDCIWWHVPTIAAGAVEWEVRGLRPAESRAGLEDKAEIFHMYDWTAGDSDTRYVGGYRENPWKHFVRKIGRAGGTVDAMEIVWKIADAYVEPDTAALSWNPNAAYRFREEWEPRGASSVFRTYRDGVLIMTKTLPGVYAPAGHSIRIGASTRRAADAGAPIDAVYRNVKVWDRTQKPPGAPAVAAPALGETVRTPCAFVAWSGDAFSRYRVRITAADDAESGIVWDSGDVAAGGAFAWTGALEDAGRYFVFVRLGNALGWGPWNAGGRSFSVDTSRPPPAATPVRILDRSAVDAAGPFLGLGATYMQALRRCKYDRARLHRDLAFLSRCGFNYVRVLSMVGWYPYWEGCEIAPVAFTSRDGRAVAAWPDYRRQLSDLIDIVAEHGMRTQITIFADAQLMPRKEARIEHMAALLELLAGREGKIMLLEVANEAWQNGFPGREGNADLREFGKYLADRTSIPVALSAPPGGTNAVLQELYCGSTADIATEHFSRDIGTVEGGWLPVRDCWRVADIAGLPPASSNEPIGPGSSVSAENDPIKLVSAAVFAYIAGLPFYVFHSSAGVKGLEPFESMAGAGDYLHLRAILPPDLPSWARNDGVQPEAPFRVHCDDRPDCYWPDHPGATRGCVRACGAAKGAVFVAFPMGILDGGVELEARRAMAFRVLDPLSGAVVHDMTSNAGERFVLSKGPGAYIIKGRYIEAAPR